MTNIMIVINECSSPEMALLMQVVKKLLTIICIIAPILLLFSLIHNFSRLMANPGDKKLLPKIRNSAIAAVVIFLIPVIVNAAMGMVSNDYQLSACWNETVEQNYKVPSYMSPTDDSGKKTILQNPSDYQKGTPKPSPSNTGSGTGTGGTGTGGTGTGGTGPGGTGGSAGLPSTPGTVSGAFEVHYINPKSRVDAIYIKAGSVSMFIDGGFKSDGKREIAYLDKIGVTHIDYYLGSHSHKNHVEAAPAIIQKYGIKQIITGRETCNGSGSTPCSLYAIQIFAKEQGVSLSGVQTSVLKPGDVFYLGGAKFSCIGPMSVNNGLDRGATAQNSNSLIIRVDYGNTSFLFTGDNSSNGNIKASNQAYPGMVNVDVLKNPHHNSCLSGDTYQLINAEYIVFTTRHDYLPSNSCVNSLKKYGAKQYFIAADGQSGNVLITSDGNNLNAYANYKD